MAASLSYSANVFGFVVGSVSLLGIVVAICRSQLPINKIKKLEKLLDETDATFKKAVEDGRLERECTQKVEHRLAALRDRTQSLNSVAYSARTTLFSIDFVGLVRTSMEIGNACQSLGVLRAEVVHSSEEGRKNIMEERPASHINAISPPSMRPIDMDPDPSLSDQATHPCLASPDRPACQPDNVPSKCTLDNPTDDATQGDSDVRTTDVQCRTSPIHTSVTLEPGA